MATIIVGSALTRDAATTRYRASILPLSTLISTSLLTSLGVDVTSVHDYGCFVKNLGKNRDIGKCLFSIPAHYWSKYRSHGRVCGPQ